MSLSEVEIENNAIAKEYKELLKISYQTLSAADKKLIRKAFDLLLKLIMVKEEDLVKHMYFTLLLLPRLFHLKLDLTLHQLLLH